MAVSVLITSEELKALTGKDEFLFKLYVCAIRQYMDYSSGIVGNKRRISYQSISEEMYVEPCRGVSSKLTGSPTKAKIQRSLKELEKLGILSKIIDKDHLVFKCLLAQRDKSVQKQVDTKPIHFRDTKADTVDKSSKQRAAKLSNDPVIYVDTLADTPENAQADTPPVSGKDTKKKETLRVSKKESYAQRKKQIPPDFAVTQRHIDYAEKNGLPNPHDEIEKFMLNHTGKRTMWVNWDSAFYLWLRNAKGFKEKSNATYQKQSASSGSAMSRIVDSIIRDRQVDAGKTITEEIPRMVR
jgi:hypothetical protein